MKKVKIFFITLGAWFRALTWAKVWDGIKKALVWLKDKFFAFINLKVAPGVMTLFFGLHIGSTHNNIFGIIGGIVIGLMGIWFIIRAINKE